MFSRADNGTVAVATLPWVDRSVIPISRSSQSGPKVLMTTPTAGSSPSWYISMISDNPANLPSTLERLDASWRNPLILLSGSVPFPKTAVGCSPSSSTMKAATTNKRRKPIFFRGQNIGLMIPQILQIQTFLLSPFLACPLLVESPKLIF